MDRRLGLLFCAVAWLFTSEITSATEYDEAVKLTRIVKAFGNTIRYYQDSKGNVLAVTPEGQPGQMQEVPINRFYWASDKKIYYQQDTEPVTEGSNIYTLRDVRFPEGARFVHNADNITVVCGGTNVVFKPLTGEALTEKQNALVYVFRFMPLSGDALDPTLIGKFKRAGADMYVLKAVLRYPYRLGQWDVSERTYKKLFYGRAGALQEVTADSNRELAMYPYEGGEGYTDPKIGHFYFPADLNKAELQPSQTIDAQGRMPLKINFLKDVMASLQTYRSGAKLSENDPELEKLRAIFGDELLDKFRPVMLNTPCNGIAN